MYKRLLLLLPALLYLLALNPYITPSTYDNIVYFEGAKSIVHHFSYSLDGLYIVGWPPALSALLAFPISLGFDSVLAAKVVILLMAVLSWQLIYQLLMEEKRPYPFLTTLLVAVSPFSLQSGSRILTEYPFLFVTFLFLLILPRIEKERSIFYTLFASFLCGFAILLRPIGIALLAPLFVQMVRRRKRAELWILGTALLTFLSWKGYVFWLESSGLFLGKNYIQLANFLYPEPLLLLRQIGSFFLEIHLIFSKENLLGYGFAIALIGIIAYGYWKTPKNSRTHQTDSYCFLMSFVLIFATWKLPRYILPIAPFLFSYFLAAFNEKNVKYLAGILLIGYLFLDGALLTVGNRSTYGGLSPIASPTPETFYKGYWLDLYQASNWLRKEKREGSVTLSGQMSGDRKYVYHWSRRHIDDDGVFLLSAPDLTEKKLAAFGSIEISTSPSR